LSRDKEAAIQAEEKNPNDVQEREEMFECGEDYCHENSNFEEDQCHENSDFGEDYYFSEPSEDIYMYGSEHMLIILNMIRL
jgi:hypothetical protein